MPRPGVTPQFAAAIGARVIRPAFFVRLQFKTEVLDIWTGLYPITWGGVTFQGAGMLMSISGIGENSEVMADGVTVTLSGIPSSLISLALNEVMRGLTVQIYLGLFDVDGVTLIPDPVLAYIGKMDQPDISDSGDTCTITVGVENALVDMNRSVWRRYTDVDQQIDHPGDLGMAFVSTIQEVQIYFGQLPQSINN